MALSSRSTGPGKMVQEPRPILKVAEWGVFRHPKTLQISTVRLK